MCNCGDVHSRSWCCFPQISPRCKHAWFRGSKCCLLEEHSYFLLPPGLPLVAVWRWRGRLYFPVSLPSTLGRVSQALKRKDRDRNRLYVCTSMYICLFLNQILVTWFAAWNRTVLDPPCKSNPHFRSGFDVFKVKVPMNTLHSHVGVGSRVQRVDQRENLPIF